MQTLERSILIFCSCLQVEIMIVVSLFTVKTYWLSAVNEITVQKVASNFDELIRANIFQEIFAKYACESSHDHCLI